MTEKSQAPEGAQVTDDMRNAVRWAPSSAYWSERLREFFGPDAREGIDALERQLSAALAAPAPQAPVALTDAVLKGAAEYWHEYGDGPGAEVSRRKAALLAFKAGARFAEGRHGIAQTKEPTNDR